MPFSLIIKVIYNQNGNVCANFCHFVAFMFFCFFLILFRLQFISVGKSRQEFEAASHIPQSSRERVDACVLTTQLTFFIPIQSRMDMRGWRCPLWARFSHLSYHNRDTTPIHACRPTWSGQFLTETAFQMILDHAKVTLKSNHHRN